MKVGKSEDKRHLGSGLERRNFSNKIKRTLSWYIGT